MLLRIERDFPPAFKESEISTEETQMPYRLPPCIWWSKDKKAAQEAVALCQSANLSCNVATAVGLHKHPLPLVQVRIRSTSILLL